MRNFVIFLLFLFPLTLFAEDTKNLTIEGTIEGMGVQSVTLLYLDRSAVQVASVTSDEQGAFVIQASITKSGVYKLQLWEKAEVFLLLKPGDHFIFKTNIGNFWQEMEYSGSDATRVYFEIEHKRDSIARIINTLNEHYKVLSNASGNDSAMHVVINQIKAQEKTRKELVKQMLSKNPSSLACLFYMNDYNIDNDSLFLERVDSALMATHPENIFVQSNHTTLQTKKTIRVGKMAPDIVLLTPEGETAKLSDFRGKIVLVDFWASWCGPCRRENPNLVRIYKEYQPKGFEIFGVSTDRDRNGWIKAIKDDNITWTQVHDEKSQYGAQWGAFSIPYTILIDREGKILEIGLRGHQLENRLKNLLKK